MKYKDYMPACHTSTLAEICNSGSLGTLQKQMLRTERALRERRLKPQTKTWAAFAPDLQLMVQIPGTRGPLCS